MEPVRLCRHPSIRTLCGAIFRPVLVGRPQFSRCCYLIIDLGSPLFDRSRTRAWAQSPELGGSARLFRSTPRRFPLGGCCAGAHRLPRLSTTCAVEQPTSVPRLRSSLGSMKLFHRDSPGHSAQKDYSLFYWTCIHHVSDYNPCQRQKEQAGIAVPPCRWLCNLNAITPTPPRRVCEGRRATDHDLGCDMTLQKLSKCHRFGFLVWILLVGCASRPSSTDIHPGFALPVCSEVRWQGGDFKNVCCTPDRKCYVMR